MAGKSSNRQGRRNRARRQNNSPGCVESGSVAVANLFPGGGPSINVFPLIPTIVPGSRLANMAASFSQYQIISSTVEYASQAPSNIDGRVVLAFAFDTREAPPTTLNEIAESAGATYGALWKNHRCRLAPRSSEKRRYAVVSRADLLAMDPEEQQIFVPAVSLFATGDSTATSANRCGTLFWRYKIRFFNPIYPAAETSSAGLLSITAQPERRQIGGPEDDEGDEE